MLRTPKRYSLHLYLGPTIPLGLAGRNDNGDDVNDDALGQPAKVPGDNSRR